MRESKSCLEFAAGMLAFLACWFVVEVRADPPSLDALYPAGGERGTTNTITAIGKLDPWPPKVWMSSEGVSFEAQTNKGQFRVTVPSDAKPGPRLIRLYNEGGTSEPRAFVVGAITEINESEPNNHFAKAQRLSQLPISVNGRLDKNGDVDSFAIDLRGGQWLDARVDSYTLMSKVDAVLRLVTTNGEQLAWNHDFTTLDPRLIWRSPSNQTVVLQIFGFAYPPGSDIGFTGGDAVVYRLHIAVNEIAPKLWNEPTETEPNDAPQNSGKLKLPGVVSATIATDKDEDRFQFQAKKDDYIEARVDAASIGSPLDAWLKIEDTAGNQLARSDDVEGSRDPRLEWRAPSNGTYVVAIGSVTHRGGKDFSYRLSVAPLAPDYRAALTVNSITLAPGSTNDLKLDFKRLRGFTNNLSVSFRGLPPGISFSSTNLPSKDATVSLPLIAGSSALPFQGPIQVVLTDAVTSSERLALFDLTTRGETGYAHLLVETSDALWLTVAKKDGEEKKPAKKK